ncbi:hypothetical protein C0Q70_12943 [Pomacea canaliculata]|uniref:Uncharacterized protein n=1 Tax=Pomacea canaliculata TaxID=400727 RepID=A0A2T7P2X9_POMCA|nr:uncharacterized protein LOC112568311 [Pomacea canaliculata]XP_025101338.1 uncharacterized protein LOC112568311 [Pomacea canaliculata]PVD27771.1 hypothetical protein C0Q70_12943 [Pomacea canaliculata]
MASCALITAVICVLITAVATIVAFATPNWLKFRGQNPTELCGNSRYLDSCNNCDCGLWLRCQGDITISGNLDNCRWFFANDFEIEQALPAWFKAVQGLMAVAVASSLLALLIGLFSLCCYCKSCNPHQAAGAFINLTFLLLTTAVCVFGAKAHTEAYAGVMAEPNSINPLFDWSFWVGVGAAGMSLISSILYFCVGRRDEIY